MIGFAREAKALRRLDRFVHVSTAYVAGDHDGHVPRGPARRGPGVPQHVRADQVGGRARRHRRRRPRPVIARPTIVMGESGSGWTPAFNVLYWPIRAFSRGLFDERPGPPGGARGRRAGRLRRRRAGAPARGHVVVRRGEPGVRPRGLHGRRARRDDLAPRFGRERPPVVAPGSTGTGSAAADDQAQVYFPYFDMDMVFDDSRARALLGPAGIRCPHLTDYFPRLIEYAQRRAGASRRSDARGGRVGGATPRREAGRAAPSTTSNSITADPCATAPCAVGARLHMAARERRALDPVLEVLVGLPVGDDEVARLALDGRSNSKPRKPAGCRLRGLAGEALLELGPAALGDLDRVDLHDHGSEAYCAGHVRRALLGHEVPTALQEHRERVVAVAVEALGERRADRVAPALQQPGRDGQPPARPAQGSRVRNWR